jgi:hypothetical protein
MFEIKLRCLKERKQNEIDLLQNKKDKADHPNRLCHNKCK